MADAPPVVPKLGMMSYLHLLFEGRSALSTLIAEGKIVIAEGHQAGIKSAAFWAAFLSAIAPVGLQIGGFVPPPYGQIVMTACALVYALSRGIAKKSDPLAGLKPFASTSEALFNIASAASNVLLAVGHASSPQTAMILASANATILSLSHGIVQSGADAPAAPYQGPPPSASQAITQAD